MPNIVDKEIVEGESCGVKKICCLKDHDLKEMSPPTCGFRNRIGLGVFNKAPRGAAELAEFPWLASVENANGKICSGSLIDKHVVMTSAGCVAGKDENQLKVRLGSWKASSSVGLKTEETHEVAKVLFHTQPVNKFNPNIALLLMKTPSSSDLLINSVCLTDTIENVNTTHCVVAGWEKGKSASDDVHVQNVKIESCEGENGIFVPERSSCGEIDHHFEDGSAVMCPIASDDEIYQQMGILISNRHSNSHTTLFANLTEFKNWIDNELQNSDITDESYTYSRLNSRFWGFFRSMINFVFEKFGIAEDHSWRSGWF